MDHASPSENIRGPFIGTCRTPTLHVVCLEKHWRSDEQSGLATKESRDQPSSLGSVRGPVIGGAPTMSDLVGLTQHEKPPEPNREAYTTTTAGKSTIAEPMVDISL